MNRERHKNFETKKKPNGDIDNVPEQKVVQNWD